MNVIGEVEGRACILIDDIVDSGGTLCNAAEALIGKGAKSVTSYCTHGVLSGGAVARIEGSRLDEMVITDSIQATETQKGSQRLRQLTVAPLLSEAILSISTEKSVSRLFN
jgi:ribose-phosphate pyrophosphokinase